MPPAAGLPVETRTLGAHPGVHPTARPPRMPNVVALPRRPGSNIDEAQPRQAEARTEREPEPASACGQPNMLRGHRMNAGAARPNANPNTSAAASRRPPADVVPLRSLRAPAPTQDDDETGEPADFDLGLRADHLGTDGVAGAEDIDGVDGIEATAGADRELAAARAPRAAALAPADDAQLAHWIERIARQEERALEALYDATSARVLGVVLRITQRAALAEEVLEDTFWQVWRQAPRFDAARGRPITWLLAMARSRAIDALRREQRFQHEALPDDDSNDAGAGAHGADEGSGAAGAPPPDLLEATRGHAQVHAALASLEPRSRQLVALAFFRGLTHEEIAAQQEMPLGTVKSLIRRALQQLRRVMEADHA